MNDSIVCQFIARHALALVRGKLYSRHHSLTPREVAELLPDREAIITELRARVVPLQLRQKAPGIDSDPWRHATPGIERMHDAEAILGHWKRNGLKPQVSWGPPLTVIHAPTGQTLAVPSYIRLEVLFYSGTRHPKDQPPYRASPEHRGRRITHRQDDRNLWCSKT